MRRFKSSILLFLLSFVFGVISLQESSALSSGLIQREAVAFVENDSNAIIELEGFGGNRHHDLDGNFETVGSIKNNTTQIIYVNIAISPDFLYVTNKSYKFNIKIGDIIREFKHFTESPQHISIKLDPGQKVLVEASLRYNQQALVITSFDIVARDISGGLQIQLNDTVETARRIVTY